MSLRFGPECSVKEVRRAFSFICQAQICPSGSYMLYGRDSSCRIEWVEMVSAPVCIQVAPFLLCKRDHSPSRLIRGDKRVVYGSLVSALVTPSSIIASALSQDLPLVSMSTPHYVDALRRYSPTLTQTFVRFHYAHVEVHGAIAR